MFVNNQALLHLIILIQYVMFDVYIFSGSLAGGLHLVLPAGAALPM